MGSSIKLAAEKLMKIADELEKEASANTYFVCDSCNHTASLAEINTRRKIAAEKDKIENLASVTVNDTIMCVACGGKMAYVPTDDSEKYYVEAEEEDLGDDIFEPVDEREEEKTETVGELHPTEEVPKEEAPIEETPEEPVPEVKEEDKIEDEEVSDGLPESDEPPALEDKSDEDISVEEETVPEEDTVSEETSEDLPGETEEETTEDITTEETPDETLEDTEDMAEEDSDVELPKKEKPKFEKIPKEAQDGFWKAVEKYSI